MAKFTVEVEEVIRYAIEVEAADEVEALNKSEEEYFATDYTVRSHKWQYDVQTNFEVVD